MRELLLIYGMSLLCSSCTNDFDAFSFANKDGSVPRDTSVSSVDSAADSIDADAGDLWDVRPSDAATDSGDAAGDTAGADVVGSVDTG